MKMPRFARLAFAVTLLLLNIDLAPLASGAQTGGVPSLADQVQALQTQVQILQTQNQTLTTTITNLQTTVVTLQSTNTGLQSALNAETAARIAAINALQAALNKETGDRTLADAILGQQLIDEQFDVAGLTSTTTHLQSEVDALNNSPVGEVFTAKGGFFYPLTNNSPTDVVSVNLPAGTYLIHAVVPMQNGDGDFQVDKCALSTDPTALGDDFSASNGILELDSLISVQVPLVGTTTLATATKVSVRCIGFNLLVEGATIEALPILSVH